MNEFILRTFQHCEKTMVSELFFVNILVGHLEQLFSAFPLETFVHLLSNRYVFIRLLSAV